ncbi:MAG: DUF1801 domain-containing protein [Lactococcus lactis]|uniref:DUF1801 domain-containing protein n=1 Tax=Pseudolactococcus carnosus TaxID=2749961 RepID=UPI001FBA414A|nr:DUF1801 domain-containing protein [Lactococcus carnosus]MBR3119959.1 DUF1801 domain-containing protein [Oceanobacillus sp.]MCJ1973681.1 DUF1801 domain-containing protein [Lactococcus carnosus]MCJ1981658.1 DUF1801 domain-containing protein [Lactococcus carnosus]MDN5474944.1 DUF1801 domain-containing protein [Lactococcus lactis]
MTPFKMPAIERIFSNYEEPYKSKLLEIRELIFTTAEMNPEVGKLTESIKWGQPTYSTLETKSGTPIRIDRFGDSDVAIFFNCHTVLVDYFREIFSRELNFSKNRAIIVNPLQNLPIDKLEFCISSALVYHKEKIGKYGL